MNCRLTVTFVGSFSPTTLAAYLTTLCAYRPTQIHAAVRKRNWTRSHGVTSRINGTRPEVGVQWAGTAAERVLDAIGWQTGKPKMDAKLLAWRRWSAYKRKAAGCG